MSFLSPVFLIAIAAVGLPLIIHLLNIRKPQRVAFSTLAFFKELQQTTIRKIRIKKYLLLLLRLLAIASLAIVLARPFLPPGTGTATNSQVPALNVILIDNSISMSRIGRDGPLFDQAREIIRSIEATSKETDRFILQTTNGEAQYSTIIGHNQLLDRLEQLEISSGGNFISGRIRSLMEVMGDAPYQNKRMFLISDGQQSQFSKLDNTLNDLDGSKITVISLENIQVQNTVITNVESSTNMIGSGLPVEITVNVANQSEIPVSNQFVSLEYEGELVGQYSVSLEAGATSRFDFEVVPSASGTSRGRVFIEGDEFPADNDYYFTIDVPETRNVLLIAGDGEENGIDSYTGLVLQAAGENDAQLRFDNAGADILGTSGLFEYDALILDGLSAIPDFALSQLQEFVQQGNGVLFLPAVDGDLRNYNQFLSQFNMGTYGGIVGDYASFRPVATANILQDDHPVYAGLFDQKEGEQLQIAVPDVFYYLKFKPSTSPGGFSLISLNTNDPLFREKRFGNGRLIVSAIGTDPGWSDFSVKPLFAPFYYRTLLYAASSDEGGFNEHILGNDLNWTVSMDLQKVKILNGNSEVIPETESVTSGVRVRYPGAEWAPGWITITDDENSKEIALNLERGESNFVEINKDDPVLGNQQFVDASDLAGDALNNEIKASGFGREIWSWFMIAGIFFLVLESLVSTYFKAESISK